MQISTQYYPEKGTDQLLMISEHSTQSNLSETKTKNKKFVILVPWEIGARLLNHQFHETLYMDGYCPTRSVAYRNKTTTKTPTTPRVLHHLRPQLQENIKIHN
jgi:hypothetical protein